MAKVLTLTDLILS